MSQVYSISAVIDLKFTERNIFAVLLKGITLGLRYYEPNFRTDDPFNLQELSLDQAVVSASTILANDINVLEARLENTFFSMYCIKNAQRIEITFSGFNYFPWMRKFKYDDEYDEDLDIPRYLKLMLDLIEDYKILELHVQKD